MAGLTEAQRDLLGRASRDPEGNPFRSLGIRQMAGGAKRRAVERMQEFGWFDSTYRITEAGRRALAEQEKTR